MSLFLTGTWEHALLAKVVSEANAVAQKQGGYLGRTALQKIVYFLQALDVPMRYRFDVHLHGPFGPRSGARPSSRLSASTSRTATPTGAAGPAAPPSR